MSRESDKPEPALQAGNGDRLDSWKEIAAYLRQGVRTVQRWEADLGLPVHRPSGKRRGTVFAFRSELDAWWEGQKNGSQEDAKQPQWLIPLAAALGLSLVAAALIYPTLAARFDEVPGTEAEATLLSLRFGQGAVSPDARWLAYADEVQLHLRLRNLRTGADRPLADEWTTSPAWSPDSRRVAFISGVKPPYRLEVVDIDTGARSVLVEGERPGAIPRPQDWSRDGERILAIRFSAGPPFRQVIGFVGVSDGSFTPFFELPPRTGASYLRLSPNGRLVAYSSRRDGNADIYAVRVDGGEEVRLTRHPDWDREPVWSPDGRYVLFDRRHGTDRDNSLRAVEVNATGNESTQGSILLADLGYDAPLLRKTFTPAGELLVGRQQSRTQCHVVETDPATGMLTGELKSDFPELSSCQNWSPDGSRITYNNWSISEGSPQTVEIERDLETGRERLITSPLAEQHPTTEWRMPDAPRNRPGYRWRFFRNRGGRTVYRFDLTTKQTETFYQAAGPITSLGISPNADYLHIKTKVPGRPQFHLWLLNLATKHARQVATTRLNPTATWSRDGRELAFPDANCLMVMAPEDPEPRRLTCAAAPDLPENAPYWGPLLQRLWLVPLAATWKQDGTKLLWGIPVPEHRRVELWAVDRVTGKHEVVLAGEKDYYTMPVGGVWSPNSKWLATDIYWYPDVEVRSIRDVLAHARDARPKWTASGASEEAGID